MDSRGGGPGGVCGPEPRPNPDVPPPAARHFRGPARARGPGLRTLPWLGRICWLAEFARLHCCPFWHPHPRNVALPHGRNCSPKGSALLLPALPLFKGLSHSPAFPPRVSGAGPPAFGVTTHPTLTPVSQLG